MLNYFNLIEASFQNKTSCTRRDDPIYSYKRFQTTQDKLSHVILQFDLIYLSCVIYYKLV